MTIQSLEFVLYTWLASHLYGNFFFFSRFILYVNGCIYLFNILFVCRIAKISVHGMEYGFGAHDFPFSGVFEVEPKSCPGFIYRCSIPLGRINMPISEFRGFIENVASEYHGDTYHLIAKNCNHFTDDMANRLTGKGIPGWVNRLAKLGKLSLHLNLHNKLELKFIKHFAYRGCSQSYMEGNPHYKSEGHGYIMFS